MARRSLNINGKSIYLKSERDYNTRLSIVNEILELYPESFDLDVEDSNIFFRNSSRLDFLTFYLIYNPRDKDILSYRQFEWIKGKELGVEF